jgi:hypothetical protein
MIDFALYITVVVEFYCIWGSTTTCNNHTAAIIPAVLGKSNDIRSIVRVVSLKLMIICNAWCCHSGFGALLWSPLYCASAVLLGDPTGPSSTIIYNRFA